MPYWVCLCVAFSECAAFLFSSAVFRLCRAIVDEDCRVHEMLPL